MTIFGLFCVSLEWKGVDGGGFRSTSGSGVLSLWSFPIEMNGGGVNVGLGLIGLALLFTVLLIFVGIKVPAKHSTVHSTLKQRINTLRCSISVCVCAQSARQVDTLTDSQKRIFCLLQWEANPPPTTVSPPDVCLSQDFPPVSELLQQDWTERVNRPFTPSSPRTNVRWVIFLALRLFVSFWPHFKLFWTVPLTFSKSDQLSNGDNECVLVRCVAVLLICLQQGAFWKPFKVYINASYNSSLLNQYF